MNKTIIVAGCTRSGLTMTMQVLSAGGYPCFGTYPAFEDYAIGYIDFEKVKGKAIKLVDSHLQFPPTGDYFVIRLRRDSMQQAKSMIKFMKFGANLPVSNKHIPDILKGLKRDYEEIDAWANRQSGMITIDFEDLILHPATTINKISEAINFPLSKEAFDAVFKRTTDCYEGMMELQFFK